MKHFLLKDVARSAVDIGNFLGDFFLKPDNWFWLLSVISAAGAGGWKVLSTKFGLSLQVSFRPDLKDRKIARLEQELIDGRNRESNLQGMLDLTRAQSRDDRERLERENDSLCDLLINLGAPEPLIRRAREVATPPDPQRPRLNSASVEGTNRKEHEPS